MGLRRSNAGLESFIFFNADGVLARTERLMLRRPIDEDVMGYIDAFGGPCPLLAHEYRRNEELRTDYWKGVKGEDSLYCSICAKENGEFMGYCAVERLKRLDSEIAINLLERFQARGFGPEAVLAFMETFRKVTGPVPFVAKIDPQNFGSQKMFRRLGFEPWGVDTLFIKDPDLLARLEEERIEELGGIPENLCSLAKEFDVEPRRLLSHVLVFRGPAI